MAPKRVSKTSARGRGVKRARRLPVRFRDREVDESTEQRTQNSQESETSDASRVAANVFPDMTQGSGTLREDPQGGVPHQANSISQSSGATGENEHLISALSSNHVTTTIVNSSLPSPVPSVSDHIGAHIPMKLKEKIWSGAFIDMAILLKSTREMTASLEIGGSLAFRDGQLYIEKQKTTPLRSIHLWTSTYNSYEHNAGEVSAKSPGDAKIHEGYQARCFEGSARLGNL